MFGRSFGVFAAAAVLMLSAISLGATYGGGSGTAEDPYQIGTAEQMNTIGANSADWDKHFKLMADIDMSAYTGTQYNIIGNETIKFTGTFDGQDHVIHNLTYNTTEKKEYVGLFGYTSGAVIQNLGVENVNFSSNHGYYIGGLVGKTSSSDLIKSCYATGSIKGFYSNVGGLVGLNSGTIISCYATSSIACVSIAGGLTGANYGIIKSCYATGTVTCSQSSTGGLVGFNYSRGAITFCYATGDVSGRTKVGGLVGWSDSGTITSCYASGSVSGSVLQAGGLVGLHESGSTITSCYASGSVWGDLYVGGLVGQNSGTIRSCYSTASVFSSSENYYVVYTGGLVGYHNNGTITNCYATGLTSSKAYAGGLVGSRNYGTTTFSFWDTQTTGQTISDGGTGKTTAEMKTLSTFTSAGWDFVGESGNGMNDIWRMCADGASYPKLSWQFASLGDFICPNGVDSDDLLYYIGQWQRTDCTSDNAYCSGVDLDYSGAVNLADWAIFASHWLGEGYVEPPLPSPGASWKMDETTGIVVSDSVGEYDGQTVNVTGTPWVAGKFNNAIKLDGTNDYVNVAGYAGVIGTSSRTCTAWIKANSTGKEQVILSWGNGANGQKWMFRVQADGKLAAAVWGGYISGSVSVADGQWHHVAAVLVDDGSPSVNEIKLYVDGFPQMVTSSSTQAINTAANQNVQMGTVYNGTAQASFFSGLLDEVRIYDVPLTGEQILRVAME